MTLTDTPVCSANVATVQPSSAMNRRSRSAAAVVLHTHEPSLSMTSLPFDPLLGPTQHAG